MCQIILLTVVRRTRIWSNKRKHDSSFGVVLPFSGRQLSVVDKGAFQMVGTHQCRYYGAEQNVKAGAVFLKGGMLFTESGERKNEPLH